MIGNFQFWITARVENGACKVEGHASATYLNQRTAAVSVFITGKEVAEVAALLADLLVSKKDELQTLATVSAAESIAVAGRMGEIGGE